MAIVVHSEWPTSKPYVQPSDICYFADTTIAAAALRTAVRAASLAMELVLPLPAVATAKSRPTDPVAARTEIHAKAVHSGIVVPSTDTAVVRQHT